MNSSWQVNIQGHLRCFIDLNAMGHSKGAADGNEIRWLRLYYVLQLKSYYSGFDPPLKNDLTLL